jgi:hypothetical protein
MDRDKIRYILEWIQLSFADEFVRLSVPQTAQLGQRKLKTQQSKV